MQQLLTRQLTILSMTRRYKSNSDSKVSIVQRLNWIPQTTNLEWCWCKAKRQRALSLQTLKHMRQTIKHKKWTKSLWWVEFQIHMQETTLRPKRDSSQRFTCQQLYFIPRLDITAIWGLKIGTRQTRWELIWLISSRIAIKSDCQASTFFSKSLKRPWHSLLGRQPRSGTMMPCAVCSVIKKASHTASACPLKSSKATSNRSDASLLNLFLRNAPIHLWTLSEDQSRHTEIYLTSLNRSTYSFHKSRTFLKIIQSRIISQFK